jgi:hypothetical protein
MNLIGYMVGCRLLWCVARFDYNKIQLNTYNNLNIEIYTTLKQPLTIHKVSMSLNETAFN